MSSSSWGRVHCNIKVVFGWADHMGNGPVSRWLDVISPPFPLIRTDADSINSTMFHHELVRPIHAFLQQMYRSTSHFAFNLREFDGASSNDRLNAHLMQVTRNNPELDDAFICRNHAHNLAVVWIVTLVGIQVQCELYSLAVFLGMGGNFLRIVAAARAYVIANLVVIRGRPPAADTEFAEQLQDYLVSNYRRERHSAETATHQTRRRGRAKPGSKGLSHYTDTLKHYFSNRNGLACADVPQIGPTIEC